MKKVVHILDSNLFNNDIRFEDEDSKESYYTTNEFWTDSDFISFDDKSISRDILVNCIKNEIVFIIPDERAFDERILNNELTELLEKFYNKDYEKFFTPLMVGNDYSFRNDKNYDENLNKIWFRGGEGYYYWCWQYNKLVDKEL